MVTRTALLMLLAMSAPAMAQTPMPRQEIVDQFVGKTVAFSSNWAKHTLKMKDDGTFFHEYGQNMGAPANWQGKWTAEDGKLCAPMCFSVVRDGSQIWFIELAGGHKGSKHKVAVR